MFLVNLLTCQLEYLLITIRILTAYIKHKDSCLNSPDTGWGYFYIRKCQRHKKTEPTINVSSVFIFWIPQKGNLLFIFLCSLCFFLCNLSPFFCTFFFQFSCCSFCSLLSLSFIFWRSKSMFETFYVIPVSTSEIRECNCSTAIIH